MIQFKPPKKALALAVLVLVLAGAILARRATAPTQDLIEPSPTPTPIGISKTLLERLAWCESRNNPLAVNPRDKDGTPSFGLFQFKPSTYRIFGAKYKILNPDINEDDLMALIFERKLQEMITSHMIADPTVDKNWQFPTCWKIVK